MNGKEALNYFMKLSRISLQIMGVWPDPGKNEWLAIFHFAAMAAYQFIAVILLQTIKLIIIWGDVDAMSEILTCALLLVVCGLAKMIALWHYKKKLMKILLCIIDDWNSTTAQEELDILISHGQFSKKVSNIYIVMALGASAARVCQIVYMNTDLWFKRYANASRYLTIDAYFPYDINHSPIFEITFVVDYIAAFFGNLSNCGTDCLFFQIGFHFTAVFRILHLKLINIVIDTNNKKFSVDFNSRLKHIIEKHEDINRGIEHLEGIFSIMLLVQLMAHSILFCMQGYTLILYLTKKNSKTVLFDAFFMVAYLLYMLGNSLIYCYVAEEFKNASIQLGKSAYECNWYNLPSEKARNLIIIILRSRKPKELTAAKFYVMNMQKFGSILKTSLGYLSLLLTLKKAH